MHLLILATAAFLAAPLPEGRGYLAGPDHLKVTSDPPGATASVRQRDGRGNEERADCVTPCTLLIRRASPLAFEVELDGHPLVRSHVGWCGEYSYPFLCPSAVHAVLPGAPLPLPSQHTGRRTHPLLVTNAPPGATASVRQRDSKGAEERISCITPGTLPIRSGANFVFAVELDGRPIVKPEYGWCGESDYTC